MAQPPAFTRTFDFEAFSTNNPTTPQPGVQIEAELDNAKTTLDALLTNIALIQRDDGALANQSVGLSQLETGLTIGVNPATNWLTATVYDEGDTVFESNNLYYCTTDHTSGVFATDLSAAKWSLILNFDTFVTAASNSAAAASTSETNAATSETNAATSETNAGTSETNAGVSETNAAASEAAAAASAAALNFDTITGGDALKYVRVNAGETGYEYITPPTIPTSASIAETDTGTDSAKFVTPDGLAGSDFGLVTIPLWLTAPDGSVAVTTTGANFFDIPASMDGMDLVSVSAVCATAGTTGTMVIDVNKNGTTMMATNKIDVLTTATTDDGTATISTAAVATGDIISVDADSIQTTPAIGVRVLLGFRKP